MQPSALPRDILLFERGWLSSNNVLLLGQDSTALVDSGYATHAPQTLALVGAALDGRPLDQLLNTHLHSDHCGGNATLQLDGSGAGSVVVSGTATGGGGGYGHYASASGGNPELKPVTGWQWDTALEFYPADKGLVSAGILSGKCNVECVDASSGCRMHAASQTQHSRMIAERIDFPRYNIDIF